MKFAVRLCILSLFAGVLIAGCSGPRAAANRPEAQAGDAKPNAPRASVEELGLLVNIPYGAEDCLWKEDVGHKKLTAVLRFDADDTAKLLGDLERVRPGEAATLPVETWFPSDMIVASDVRGDDQLRGIAYAADPFFLAPYSAGRLVRVEDTDYFVLQLSAK